MWYECEHTYILVLVTVYLYHCSHTEIDDMIRKSTNLLLTRTLGSCLSSLIKKPSLTLLQVSFILQILLIIAVPF